MRRRKAGMRAMTACLCALAVPAAAGAAGTLEAWLESMGEAYRACDPDAVTALSTDDVTGFPVVGGLTSGAGTSGIAEFCAGGGEYDIDLAAQEIVDKGDWGVIAGVSTGTATFPDGEEVDVTNRFTTVMERTAEGWRMIHYHLSPFGTNQ